MSEPNERYKQLALFTLILAEVVVTPAVLAGGVYWLFRNESFRNVAVFLAALGGLIIGFYRVALIQKRMKKNEPGQK